MAWSFSFVWVLKIYDVFRHKRYSFSFQFFIQVHQKSCRGKEFAVKVANNQSSPIQQNNSTNNNTVPKKSLDLLYMNSPSLMRRTLHNQDDTIIASHTTYEDSLLKQVQTKKDNNATTD